VHTVQLSNVPGIFVSYYTDKVIIRFTVLEMPAGVETSKRDWNKVHFFGQSRLGDRNESLHPLAEPRSANYRS
jgi:hypothetical protein